MHVWCIGAPLNIFYFILFFSIAAAEIHIICENFNCLTITVHEIQPGDRRTVSGVLVIGSRFIPWVRNPKKQDSITAASLYRINIKDT